jgi:hypothetical protein
VTQDPGAPRGGGIVGVGLGVGLGLGLVDGLGDVLGDAAAAVGPDPLEQPATKALSANPDTSTRARVGVSIASEL